MATVRLEFDLDSDVYPELHAALSELRSVRARGERIRQLAAAGLVWENVRIYGAAAIGPSPATAVAQRPVPLRAEAEPAPSPLAAPPPKERRASSRSRAAPPAVRPVADPRGADFIDLAIDAEPQPEPGVTAAEVRDGIEAQGSLQREAEQVVRELPVLMDVVADSEVISDAVESRPSPLQAVPHALPPSAAHAGHELAHAAPEEGDHALATADDTLHLPSLAQKPATRSRLMRMKDKGLFRNG